MNKKDLSEADIRTKFITPALVGPDGNKWDVMTQLLEYFNEECGRGYSEDNLSLMRKFFLEFSPRIPQTPSGKLASLGTAQTPSAQLAAGRISETASWKSSFTLSWSHYVLLLTIKDADERSFYEIESTNEGWSLSELKRQKASALYERLAMSRNKADVKRLARKGQVVTKPEDVLKEPYVLEFLGLDEKAGYSESDLESAIISQIERFLLEQTPTSTPGNTSSTCPRRSF